MASDRSLVEMFLDEGCISARLRHPNIADVYELGHVDGNYFISMEYVRGRSVFELLVESERRRRPPPVDVALGIVTGACEGLAFAHARGVVHRDVSPQNLLLSYDGFVKVVDFGIARAPNRIHRTGFGDIKGKPSYMSPEQALGLAVDQRTDVYALGVLLHELLTGRRLVPRADVLTLVDGKPPSLPPPPSHVTPSLPKDLDEITRRALAHDPGSRLPSCDELRERLDDVLLQLGASNNAATRRARLLSEWLPEKGATP
jgi:serine/threonine-protein kinase